MKHTKGNWNPVSDDGEMYVSSEFRGGEDIALVYGSPEDSEVQANAKLISAAPELLEACNKATFEIRNLENFSENERLNDAMEVLVQAIKKATE